MARKKAVQTKELVPVVPAVPQTESVHDSLFDTMAGLIKTNGLASYLTQYYSLSTREIEQAMLWDGVLQTYINRPAEDCLSNGVTWKKLSEKQQTQVNDWLDNYQFFDRCIEAYQAMDRTGFAAIWMDTGALDNAKPMRHGELSRLRELVVLDADALHASAHHYSMYSDPKVWTIRDADAGQRAPEIHASRLLIFPGFAPSRRARYNNGGKGFPKAMAIWKSLEGYNKVNETAPNIAEVFEEPTMYIEGLNRKLGEPNGKKQIQARVTDFAMTRKATRVAAMDATEKYERPGPPLTGLDVIYDNAADFFLNKTGWPRSILFSSLKGGSLGGDGASKGEEQEWAKYIARQQKKWPDPVLKRFFRLLKEAIFKRFDLSYEWPPLHQHSEKEWAEIEEIRSRRDRTYLDKRVLSNKELRKKLAADGTYDIDPNAEVTEPDEPQSSKEVEEPDPEDPPQE